MDTTTLLCCYICDTPFTRRQGQNKYCGEACRRENERRHRLQKRAERGQRIQGETFTCERCGGAAILTSGGGRYCEDCKKARRIETIKAYRKRDPEKRRAIQKSADEKKRGSAAWRQWSRNYSRLKSARKRGHPRGRLDHRMGQLVRSGLGKGVKAGRTWETLVGYTIDALALHIERQFLTGMSWGNMDEWHIDHIIPKTLFHYQDVDDPEFRACWALTNLRPLWSGDNLSKGARRTLLI